MIDLHIGDNATNKIYDAETEQENNTLTKTKARIREKKDNLIGITCELPLYTS